MLFRKAKRLRTATAIVVLGTFGWMMPGGNVWAESRAARRDPGTTLARLADDPRICLSKEQRQQLREAARDLSVDPLRAPAGTVERDAAFELHELGAELERLTLEAGSGQAEPGESAAEAVADLQRRLEVANRRVLREFGETEAMLRTADLPNVIWERHEAARADYQSHVQTVIEELSLAGTSRDPREIRGAMAEAAKLLSESMEGRPHQPLDPSRMPFRRPEPVERKPGEASTSEALEAFSVPQAASVTPPGPGDLAANEDAQITPEIQALAASLGNQPLAIYNWVRNHIDFVPTYGSVQGSQMTLDAKRGNAFDTASLLVALLRAAGVPARYVTGTVEVPVATVMNWVGGVPSPKVAQQLLGQGGVPNVGLISGGTLTHIRIDHVWVEAFIDNVPSRGAIHHQGDTWVPMDPSFKLHTFTPRSELFTVNPISAVIDPGDHLFDVDEALGKVTDVDSQPLEDRLIAWAEQNDEYFIAHGGYPATIEEVVGGKVIDLVTSTVFPASLPYHVLVRRAAVSTLPDSLRHYLLLKGFGSQLDRTFGSVAFSVRLSLPELNSRRLGLQFDPATQADADTLEAARDGGAGSLPLYLVNVVPVITVDGVERGRGGSIRMGSFYFVDVVFQAPGGPTTVPYQIVAGDEIVVGVTGNGVTQEVLEKRFASHPVDNAQEYFHQVQLHYWMESDYLGEAAAKAHGVFMQRLPSVGFFSSPLTASYLFGAPRSGFYQGRGMDVRHSLLGAAGPDRAKVVEFIKQAGFQGSYLEGAVYDQLKDRSDPRVKGISSVHLITDAMAQGVPIYRITSANSASVLPLLALSSAVESDIATALSQGKTVLVPERNIDLGPWTGVGYIIQDETTGAGAYLISGGLAGGWLLDCLKKLVPSWDTIQAILFILLLVALIIAAILTFPEGELVAASIVLFLLLVGGLGGTNTDPVPST